MRGFLLLSVRNMKQENRFRLQVGLVMLCLLLGFVWFVDAFELDYRFALSKLPLLAGLELSPEGFIQGIPLTLLLCLLWLRWLREWGTRHPRRRSRSRRQP